MSRRPTELPERLLAGDATDFERRLIDAALEKRPSAAASARIARALGVTVTGIGTAAAAKALAATRVTAEGSIPVVASTSGVWTWVSVGVLGLGVAGAVVSARGRHTSRLEPRAVLAAPPAASTPETELGPRTWRAVPATTERPPASVSSSRRPTRRPTDGDLRDQIALIDSARDALTVGSPHRSLEILHRYQEHYPSGSFRPEATATMIEALVKLGRATDARALAIRFVAEHPDSLLAARVAELVGLPTPGSVP